MICVRHDTDTFRFISPASTPGWTRTIDPRFRKPILFPLSYGGIARTVLFQLSYGLAFTRIGRTRTCISVVGGALPIELGQPAAWPRDSNPDLHPLFNFFQYSLDGVIRTPNELSLAGFVARGHIQFDDVEIQCRGMDSNHRSPKATDLQSAVFAA